MGYYAIIDEVTEIEQISKQFLLLIEEMEEKITKYADGYREIEKNWKEGKIAEESLEEQQIIFKEVNLKINEKTDEVEATLNGISDIIGRTAIGTALIEAGFRMVSAKIEALRQTIGEYEEAHKDSDFVTMEELMTALEQKIYAYIDRRKEIKWEEFIVEVQPIKDQVYIHNANMVSQITTIESEFVKERDDFKAAYERNKEVYEEISKEVGVPPELIAIIHYREASQDYLQGKFGVHLHNGDPLGQPTIHHPVGKEFTDFVDAAIDALSEKSNFIEMYHLNSDTNDIVAMMSFAERYNGLGYYLQGYINPYLYSGTNLYESGKFTSDGKYDPEAVDQQIGVYILLDSIVLD